MIRTLLQAYVITSIAFLVGLTSYTIVVNEVIEPLIFKTFFPYAATPPRQPSQHRAADAICQYANALSKAATTASNFVTRAYHVICNPDNMGGWFSRTEVINNGTSSVEYHVETLKVTLLIVGGAILVLSLTGVCAKLCYMSREKSVRRAGEAQREISLRALESAKAEHSKEIDSIRNSINLQNAQMGSRMGSLATARELQQVPGSDPKPFIYPNF